MTRLLLALALASPAFAGCEPLVLAWDESPGADGYSLERTQDGLPQPSVWTVATEWSTENEPPGLWEYRVRAVREGIESASSNAVLAEIRPLDPACDEPVECELGIERIHAESVYGRTEDGLLDLSRVITTVTTLVGWPVCEEGP